MQNHLLSAYLTLTPVIALVSIGVFRPPDAFRYAFMILVIAYLVTAAIGIVVIVRRREAPILAGWFGLAAVAFGLLVLLTSLDDLARSFQRHQGTLVFAVVTILVGITSLRFSGLFSVAKGIFAASDSGSTKAAEGDDDSVLRHRGKEITFAFTTGEVIGANKYSETHVSSYGGGGSIGGYVGPQGGYVSGPVSAPTVTSTVTTKQEFWLRTDKGEQEPVKLSGVDIPLLVGQRVTLLSAHRKGRNLGPYSRLINHSADRYWTINDVREIKRSLGIERFSVFYVFLTSGFLGIWLLFGRPRSRFGDDSAGLFWDFILVGLIVFLIYRVIRWSGARQFEARLRDRIEKLTRFAFQNFGQPSQFTAMDALRSAQSIQAKATAGSPSGARTINLDIS